MDDTKTRKSKDRLDELNTLAKACPNEIIVRFPTAAAMRKFLTGTLGAKKDPFKKSKRAAIFLTKEGVSVCFGWSNYPNANLARKAQQKKPRGRSRS